MKELIKLQIFMNSRKFRMLPQDRKQDIIKCVRLTTHRVGNLMSIIVGRKVSSSNHTEGRWKEVWKRIKDLIVGMLENIGMLKDVIPEFIKEDILSSNYRTLQANMHILALFFNTAFPDFKRIPNIKFKIQTELGNLPWQIFEACEGQPQALVLVGGLLSFKPTTYDTWDRVKDDLIKIKEYNKGVTSNYWYIINYCFDDLPYFLKLCFLYFACYPIGYEIPVTSLINLWIAEGFVTPGQGEWNAKEFVSSEKEESTEEIANKYLEKLIQRSLVYVSKRSLLGTIKSCRVPRQIHEFAIKKSNKDEFLVANPDQEKIESLFRLAIHHDNKKQYTEVKNNHLHSFIAFNFDGNVLGSALLLRVLELRKSTIPVNVLPNMISLQYMGLRGSKISELPKNIGDMKYLLTLDVRDTGVETLPESLWNIRNLRHVYVKPSPQIKGPPSAAHINNLHTLKTVVAHESWVENIPHFLVHLRKLALSNGDILDFKSIYNLLSRMDKLISMAIMRTTIPSESVDLRAFPNLETVKSIKLDGQWNCRKLFIDNVKFPPNLAKLILTNSSLKEDPMPTLGKLQALKFLSLQDGAYIGNQMVCFDGGFPQLEFLKLKKLENLENWEVKEGAMSRLTTVRVVQCGKLNPPSNLRVTITDIDD